MKRKINLVILLLVLFIYKSYSQNIYIGEKSYPTTWREWSFDDSIKNHKVSLRIGRDNDKGILQLKIDLSYNSCQSSKTGNLYLYLSNNIVIKCIYRGNKECEDENILSHYRLTTSEVSKLSKYRIKSIKYYVNGSGYTARNLRISKYTDVFGNPKPKQNKTELDVSSLYRDK